MFIVSGDEVGVEVGFEDAANHGTVHPRGVDVDVDIPPRINHGSLSVGKEQVRRMRQTAEIKLFKMHVPSIS
jgi:hypothetical protein